MTFLELYGDAITTEIGTSDTTQRFTTARRKAAVNFGMQEFNRLTNCFVKRYDLALVDETAEYNLQAVSDFFRLPGAQQLPVIRIVDGSDTTYIGGKELPQRSTDWLDTNESGWRNADAGTPTAWYLREDADDTYFGLSPAPSITGAEVWTARIPYVAVPATLTADADVPFAALPRLIPYHQAIAHLASAKMELLRKNYGAADRQIQIASGYIADFVTSRGVEGPQHVQFQRDYLGDANMHRATLETGDPRR